MSGDGQYFVGKPHARVHMWEQLEAAGAGARSIRGRVPRFDGFERAAERLLELPQLRGAKQVRIGREAVLEPVRRLALAQGMTVYVPTWHLRRGLRRIEPEAPWATGPSALVPLAEVPTLDAFVVAALAVARDGYFVGPGGGWADLEHTILRELGHGPMPVYTIAHPTQLVRWFPAYEHDVPVSAYATPEGATTLENPPPAPRRIEWTRLARERLGDVPILKTLRARS